MKVNVSKKQIIACVLIVILAVVVGAVGLYGLSSRSSDDGVKLVQERRVLLRDQNDNRYEIPDLQQLDKHSRQQIDSFL